MEQGEEIFLPIPGYTRYLINNIGVVKRIKHTITQINRWGELMERVKEERILTPRTNTGGYLRVALCEKNRIEYCVHRLVLMAFKPNTKNLSQINHIDGNKLNNHVDNLEWCTASHNIKHAFDLGLNYSASGFDDPQSKPVKLFYLGKLIWVFGSIGEASRLLPASRTTVMNNLKSKKPINGLSPIMKGCKLEYYES